MVFAVRSPVDPQREVDLGVADRDQEAVADGEGGVGAKVGDHHVVLHVRGGQAGAAEFSALFLDGVAAHPDLRVFQGLT